MPKPLQSVAAASPRQFLGAASAAAPAATCDTAAVYVYYGFLLVLGLAAEVSLRARCGVDGPPRFHERSAVAPGTSGDLRAAGQCLLSH